MARYSKTLAIWDTVEDFTFVFAFAIKMYFWSIFAGLILGGVVSFIVLFTMVLLGDDAWPLGILFSVPLLVFLWSTWEYVHIVREEAEKQAKERNWRYRYYYVVEADSPRLASR